MRTPIHENRCVSTPAPVPESGVAPGHIALFGATRGVGRHVVELGIAAGHTICALTRGPRTPVDREFTHARLGWVVGDVTDADAVRRTLAGADTVICALGAKPSNRDGVRAAGTRQILAGMHALGIRRLLCVSMLGVGDSLEGLPFFLRYVLVPLWLRHVAKDHGTQEQLIGASGLDWTIVRPPFLTDGPRTGEFAHGFGNDAPGLTLKISRAEVAGFLLRQAVRKEYVGRAVGISYRA